MEHIELIFKLLALGGFIVMMTWLDRRYDWGLNEAECLFGGNQTRRERDALKERVAQLEAVVSDRDWQLDREFDVLTRR